MNKKEIIAIIGYISSFPSYRLTKSGTIKNFKVVSYFLYSGIILQKRVRANARSFLLTKNTTSMDLFENSRLDVVEIFNVDNK